MGSGFAGFVLGVRNGMCVQLDILLTLIKTIVLKTDKDNYINHICVFNGCFSELARY